LNANDKDISINSFLKRQGPCELIMHRKKSSEKLAQNLINKQSNGVKKQSER